MNLIASKFVHKLCQIIMRDMMTFHALSYIKPNLPVAGFTMPKSFIMSQQIRKKRRYLGCGTNFWTPCIILLSQSTFPNKSFLFSTKICHFRPWWSLYERKPGNKYAVIGPKYCDGSFLRPRKLQTFIVFFICHVI